MRLFRDLIESLLMEAAALTKGSQRVMNDPKLVANLADSVRDDARTNPASFPPGSARTFQKTSDEAIAQWFLENIDDIERKGYEDTVYSRDGVNSDWIVRRYIAGSHNWEDLTGVMNMNLRDWYLLKNRNMLDANHKDLPKFNSVRDVGYYMTTHYKDKLEKLRDAVKNAARNKMAKSIKLVDNDDYRIYTTLNRAAGCALGLGTQWCTANSNTGAHFHRYTNAAMLFQLFPYIKEKDEEGKHTLNEHEKYQFDGGSGSFMDITDTPARATVVKERYPYIYTDLISALKTNKPKMEQAFADLSQDPTLQAEDFKIKTYEIDDEIKKLHKFVDRGFFTDEKRPTKTSNEPEQSTQPEQGQVVMKQNEITEDKTLGHIVQQYKPVDTAGQESPLTHGEDNLDEEEVGECVGIEQAKAKLVQTLASRYGKAEVEEDDAMQMQDPDQGAQAQTGGTLGAAGAVGGGSGQYPPGTAPTMPESITLESNEQHEQNKDAAQREMDKRSAEGEDMSDYEIDGKTYAIKKKEKTMENVDKDVAAMLQSLKKYDILKESVAPVLGMKTLGEKDEGKHNNATTGFKAVAKKAAAEYGSKEAGERVAGAVRNKMKASGKIEEEGNPWEKLGADKSVEKREDEKSKTHKGGEVTKTKTGLIHKEGDKKDKVEEGADQEVLDWMNRFSKLGNMKGYGR